MNVNLIAVLVGAIINMVLGFLWYGPLFGKPWQKLSGLTDAKLNEMKKKGMSQVYFFSMIGALLMAFVLSMMVNLTGTLGMMDGVKLGFWIWLGFVAPTMLNSVLYEDRSWNLYWINSGYYLVALMIIGGVLASWM